METHFILSTRGTAEAVPLTKRAFLKVLEVDEINAEAFEVLVVKSGQAKIVHTGRCGDKCVFQRWAVTLVDGCNDHSSTGVGYVGIDGQDAQVSGNIGFRW